MAVTIQDDMWRVAKRLPREYRDRLIGALVAYGLDGELPDESELSIVNQIAKITNHSRLAVARKLTELIRSTHGVMRIKS